MPSSDERTGRSRPSEACARLQASQADPAGRGFAALSQSPLTSQFLAWRGASGKSYVVSIYAPADCPPFCDAILLTVARDQAGVRRILAAIDTGAFPEPVVARAERDLGASAEAIEFHVHLLARTAAERRAILADLDAGSQRFRPPNLR